MGYRLPYPKFGGFDERGVPLAGGLLYAFGAGSNTGATTYSDDDLTSANASPITLNARGEATVYLAAGAGYKFILRNASGAVQWTRDGVLIPPPAALFDPNVPVGTVLPWPAAAAPTGYLLCDGSAVSRATYAALFAVLSTAWGAGDGSTTFNLPDLRGRFPLGKATSGTGSTLGSTGGSLDHTHSVAAHTHTTDSVGHTHTVSQNGWGETAASGHATGTLLTQDSGTPGQMAGNGVNTATYSHSHTAQSGGAATTGTGNPPFQVVNYVVKT